MSRGIVIELNVSGSDEVADEEAERLAQTLRDAGYDVNDAYVIDIEEGA